jgi:hypothetical protein
MSRQKNTTVPLAQAVPVDMDSVNSDIPIAKAEPSAPPAQIAPDNIEDWPPVRVYGIDFRRSLVELKQTIDVLELWDFMKNNNPPDNSGYMFWGHENINLISKKLDELYVNDHSGATWGYAMRVMQAIAKKGFENFKHEFNVKLKN